MNYNGTEGSHIYYTLIIFTICEPFQAQIMKLPKCAQRKITLNNLNRINFSDLEAWQTVVLSGFEDFSDPDKTPGIWMKNQGIALHTVSLPTRVGRKCTLKRRLLDFGSSMSNTKIIIFQEQDKFTPTDGSRGQQLSRQVWPRQQGSSQ